MTNLVTVESINAVVDTDAGIIVGLAPSGINDTSYIPVMSTPGYYASFSTSALTNNQLGKVLLPTNSSQTATINAGLVDGFWCAFNNNVTFSAGVGVTITDKRTTGAGNPTCTVVNTGVDTYEIWGTKP